MYLSIKSTIKSQLYIYSCMFMYPVFYESTDSQLSR